MVPKTWVKFIVGLFLLPPAWIFTKTFFDTLIAALHHGLLGWWGWGGYHYLICPYATYWGNYKRCWWYGMCRWYIYLFAGAIKWESDD